VRSCPDGTGAALPYHERVNAPKPPAATFDSLVLAAVVREIRGVLPARLGRAAHAGSAEIVLPLRAGRARGVLLSCDARWARAHLVTRIPEFDLVTPFSQLLRARFDDARVVDVRQRPFERVLIFEIEALDGPYRLIAELMGKHANVLLTSGDDILGAMKIVGPERSRRPVVPGRPYEAPPPDPRPTPATVTANDLRAAARGAPEPLWRRVLTAVSGIGPLAAYDLTARAGADPEATAAVAEDTFPAVAAACRAIAAAVADGSFQPQLLLADGVADGFAPWPLHGFTSERQLPATMSNAIDQTLAARARRAALEDERRALLQRVDAVFGRKQRALAESRDALRAAEDAPRLRRCGELLLAYASFIPTGAGAHETTDYDGTPITIALDPRATAIENAQAYFRRYAKAQAVSRTLPARIAQLEADLAFLTGTRLYVELAAETGDLSDLRDELVAGGYLEARREKRRGAGTKRGNADTPATRTHEVDGFAVVVGRTNRDNDRVTFKLAAPDDLWLHARGVPGAHVLLRVAGRVPPPAVVEAAAAIAAYHSAARDATHVAVDVTERRNVWKPKGAAPGAVLYRNERTLHARPRAPDAVTPALR